MRKKTKRLILLHSLCAAATIYYFMHNSKVQRTRELKEKVQIITEQYITYATRCTKLQKKYDFLTQHEEFAREQSMRLDLNMGLTNEFIYLVTCKK